ncbi:Protein of unknown function [Cognatiyoonia koreensis]|uniref:DUF998 domain-containing protein n=1 Tax=Cognatiyoonia koreensis TaxID=364200 RepID=A0A1I0MZC6_9RHOB|nr:DUF998 domain-containing protein [Cognatiyoonia koreensis]SEV94118.1 Protein of unknown function [Cognatiyoonia koreensis]
MSDHKTDPLLNTQPWLLLVLGWYAVFGCAAFIASIFIADAVVPNHDWIADTISDLGAGEYEFIVDIGLYAFSASLISVALIAAHEHLGGWRWSVGLVCLAILGLIVFLVGARNEYGDNDSEGVVIHIYLVYGLGVLMSVIPWLMAKGTNRVSTTYGRLLTGMSALWILSAPIFFILPTAYDGIYERYLGLIAIAVVLTLAHLFIRRGNLIRAKTT